MADGQELVRLVGPSKNPPIRRDASAATPLARACVASPTAANRPRRPTQAMLSRTKRLICTSTLLFAVAGAGCHSSNAGPGDQAVGVAPVPHDLVTASLPDEASLPGLVQRVAPSVVSITATKQATPSQGRPDLHRLPDMFRFRGPRERPQRGAGSGFVVDAAGYVVTNAHVVDGSDQVLVQLYDERELSARVVGKDDKLDLALLQIEGAGPLPAVTLGDSGALRVGEHVLAVGNPFGLGHTVTLGIVSGKTRAIGAGPYDAFIQTDASINPGNSGGPLFDLSGRVVGINTAIRPGADGIGFAIPVDDLKDVLAQLKDKGHVERGRLGLRFQAVTPALAKALGLPNAQGALVAEVEARSPAAQAGIQQGDVVVAVDGSPLTHHNQLARAVARRAPGSTVAIRVHRDGKHLDVKAKLGKLADENDEKLGRQRPRSSTPSATVQGLELADSDQGVTIVGFAKAHDQLRVGDRIVEVEGNPVSSVAELEKRIASAKRSAVLLKIDRNGSTLFVGLDRS